VTSVRDGALQGTADAWEIGYTANTPPRVDWVKAPGPGLPDGLRIRGPLNGAIVESTQAPQQARSSPLIDDGT